MWRVIFSFILVINDFAENSHNKNDDFAENSHNEIDDFAENSYKKIDDFVKRCFMFRRKIYDQLLKWKEESNGKTALLIEGPRRVGKSTVVESFAKKEYESYILVDFYMASADTKKLFDDLSEEFGNYWTQSETYESLRIYIDMDFDGLKEVIMDLLVGKAYHLNNRTFQNDMTTVKNKDDVLTLLVHLGYLAYYSKDGTISIPNEEVRKEFLDAIEMG